MIAIILPIVISVHVASAQQRPPSPQTPQTPADALRGAQQSAGEIQQLRAALRGPDASARVSAFSAMIMSNNASLIAMAISEGRASADSVLRDLAVRAAFREVKSFAAEPVSELSGKAPELYARFAGDQGCLLVQIAEYDWQSGAFKATRDFYGQVSAGRLSFANNCCQGNLLAVEGTWAFEGIVSCKWGEMLRERMRVHIR